MSYSCIDVTSDIDPGHYLGSQHIGHQRSFATKRASQYTYFSMILKRGGFVKNDKIRVDICSARCELQGLGYMAEIHTNSRFVLKFLKIVLARPSQSNTYCQIMTINQENCPIYVLSCLIRPDSALKCRPIKQ